MPLFSFSLVLDVGVKNKTKRKAPLGYYPSRAFSQAGSLSRLLLGRDGGFALAGLLFDLGVDVGVLQG